MTFPFDNTYARLPERFYARVAPTKVREPRLIKVNHPLAQLLGLDPAWLESPLGAQILTGNVVPEEAASIALAYAGHQFGGFVPQLGDGRAILLGEVVGIDGKRRDLQLKGAGRTPFSRGGDGRAALGPVLREYIVSEAMAAMGIPTTRALAAATTGEPVIREEVLPGAVLTRVAASHIRVGTFQFFAARQDREALSALTEYALARHYPHHASRSESNESPALCLLDGVIEAQAKLVARWLGVGFVHGVMNTDNTAISGETIDYGPCAFLDEYDPSKKFSSIDHGGRYAFAQQPRIAHWNLARFAETLLPLVSDDQAEAVRLATEHLQRFPALFEAAYGEVMRTKIGLPLCVAQEESDRLLIDGLLQRIAANTVDYTLFFRHLGDAAEDPAADTRVAAHFADPSTYTEWAAAWRARQREDDLSPDLRATMMRRANPAFIPRNHRVEEAIAAAMRDDLAPFEDLVSALARPYEDQPSFAHLADPPRPEERVQATFCGT